MLIDTHVHLDAAEFAADRSAQIAAARAGGVRAFVVPAVERGTFAAVQALAASEADVHCALGIHPLYVDRANPADLQVLDAMLADPRVIAVGEIGLDRFVAEPDFARQTDYYHAQLRLAAKHDLPVILHLRRAVDMVLQGLRRIAVPGGIAHAFNGSRQQAEQLIAMGFRLGFGGAMSFEGSTRIRELAASLPLSAIVLETDAPDMPPAWARGQRNLPANLPRYAELLAKLRGLSVDEVIAVTGANAPAALPRLRAFMAPGD